MSLFTPGVGSVAAPESGTSGPVETVVGAGHPDPLVLAVTFVDPDYLDGSVVASDKGLVAAVWGIRVEIDGVDKTSEIVGTVLVDAEESAARVADVELSQAPGTVVELTAWVGKTVSVFVVDKVGGAAENPITIFSGFVETPSVTPGGGVIRLSCTDNLQTAVGSLPMENAEALVPGSRWSPAVFNAGSSAFVHVQDRLSTVPSALDLDPLGVIRVTPWASKATADFTFSDDDILDQSVAVDLSGRSTLTNRVDIRFGYRFPKAKVEGWLIGYDFLALNHTNFGYWVRDGNQFLQRAAVEAALGKAGVNIVSITWIPLPTTPQIIPGTGGAEAGVWLPYEPADIQYCLGFAAVVSFDYGQQADEVHEITVSAPGSVAVIGSVAESISGALDGVYEDIQVAENNVLLYRAKITTIPPGNMPPISVGLTTSVDATLSADTNRAAAESAMETLIAIAMVKIQAAHRRHTVSASCPCQPVLDVSHTVALDADGVTASGKVRKVSHRLDVASGSAITEFSLAVCSIAGTGFVHPSDPVVAPGPSSSEPTPLAVPAVSWNGKHGEDGVISITLAAVDEAERAKAEISIKTAYSAPLHEDPLEVIL